MQTNLWFARTAEAVLAFIYPAHCPICDRRLKSVRGEKRLICKDCARNLPLTGKHWCMKCGKPLTDPQREYCADCMRRKHVYERHRAVLIYHGGVRKSLYRFKYANRRCYAGFYAELICAELGAYMKSMRITLLVPVPLSKKRALKRGYNQAGILARQMGRILGIPVAEDLLLRVGETLPMKGLSVKERVRNLEGAFCAAYAVDRRERILLIDDIYTTGATMDAAAAALYRAGCTCVCAVSVAIGG